MRRPRRQAHRLHDHRQFPRREGGLSAAPAGRRIRVRRAGGARPPRLARFRLPAGRPLRRARHFRPFRQPDRVLLRSAGDARIPGGRRDGARLLQRLLPGRVLAAEGGLSLRLQHDERAADHEHVARSRAKPRPLRALARRSAAAGARARPAPRRKQPRSHAPHFHERARHLRLLRPGAARPDRRGRFSTATSIRRRRRSSAAAARTRSSSAISPRARWWSPAVSPTRPAARLTGATSANSSTSACRRRTKLGFIHDLLRRDMAEVRMFLERIEELFASLTPAERQAPSYLRGAATRSRATTPRATGTCALPRTPTCPRTRARMIELAGHARLAVAGRTARRARANGRRPDRAGIHRPLRRRPDLLVERRRQAGRRAPPAASVAARTPPRRTMPRRSPASAASRRARACCGR